MIRDVNISHVFPVAIGSYYRFEVTPPCGLVSNEGLIGMFDDPAAFYDVNRVQAGLLWFHSGFVQYVIAGARVDSATSALDVTLEVCSDAPGFSDDYPSDITLWINDSEVGTWRSPGDFGGKRGLLTPSWWSAQDTQFGVLKRWTVNRKGSFLDGEYLGPLTIGDLVADEDALTLRIGLKADAERVGGINVFGSTFGNHPQDILVDITR